jgi:hypothetical protein
MENCGNKMINDFGEFNLDDRYIAIPMQTDDSEFSKVCHWEEDYSSLKFDPIEDLLAKDLLSLDFYKKKPSVYTHRRFVQKLESLCEFCTDEGQRNLLNKFLTTLNTVWGLYMMRMNGGPAFQQALHALVSQTRRVSNLLRSNSVLHQHYGQNDSSVCVFVPLGRHKICSNHTFSRTSFVSRSQSLPVKGLVDPHAAWGTFADLGEYETYVALLSNHRNQEAAAFAAALAGGAHAHTLRDPFPFGHCKLLLFKPKFWPELFKHGEDVLVKADLDDNRDKLDLDKVVLFSVDANNNQAHISMHRTPVPGAMSVLVDVRQLVEFLDKAFEDGVCDYEELVYMYYNIKPAKRK